jgi:hypothetical protein
LVEYQRRGEERGVLQIGNIKEILNIKKKMLFFYRSRGLLFFLIRPDLGQN